MISYDTYQDKRVNQNEMILLPSNTNYRLDVLEDSYWMAIAFTLHLKLCESYSMTELYAYRKAKLAEFVALTANTQLTMYIDLLELYMKDGINCIHLYDMKKTEIFYILRAYYPKELLADFFYPILIKEDLYFKKFVISNCLSAKNVQALAKMANYSSSGFIKKFMRCFDEAPHRWISKYKADRILHDIKSEVKTFKEISVEYNFSSMPHFIAFCRQQYGITPGKLRKKSLSEDVKNAVSVES